MNRLRVQIQRPTLVRGIATLSIGAASASTLGAAVYWLATRKQKFHELNDPNDGLLRSQFYARYNPHGNEDLSDIYEARIPVSEIRPDLISDFRRGGSKLVERYCSGLLGGWGTLTLGDLLVVYMLILCVGFAVQRRLSIRRARQAETASPDELYTKAQIMDSTFEEGMLG